MKGVIDMDRRDRASELRRQGFNCCQAVILAYSDLLDLPEETLRRMGAGFGGGMGTMEGTCGALCGAQMVLGLLEAGEKPVGAKARAVLNGFKEKAGATRCRDLKGIDTGTVLCGCDDCVRFAVDALEAVRGK